MIKKKEKFYCEKCKKEMIDGVPNYVKKITRGDWSTEYKYWHVECVSEKQKEIANNNNW